MASFNKIQIVGYLGRDPELRYTPSGTPVCDFSVATSERRGRSDDQSREEITTWFRVTLWGRQAEIANQYLQKGKLVFVEGRLSQREWNDRDGNQRTTLEVHGTDLQFIGSRGDEAGIHAGRTEATAPAQTTRRSESTRREERPRAVARGGQADDSEIPF